MNSTNEIRISSSGESLPLVLIALHTVFFGSWAIFLFGYAVFRHLEETGIIEGTGNGRYTAGEVALVEENEPLSHGATLYQSCVACHGNNGEGNALLKAPAINRQNETYLYSQLIKFKEGQRGTHASDTEGATMRPMAQMLVDDEAINSVIDHIKSLTAPLPPETSMGDPGKGQAAFALCSACHGADGKGNSEIKSATLVGLQDWYIVNTLKKFKEGVRAYHPEDSEGAQMKPMSMSVVSEEAMQDLAAYVNKLARAED
jgi:cytochrome c553